MIRLIVFNVYSLLFVMFALGSRSVIIVLSRTSITMFSYEIVQRFITKCLILIGVALFRFVLFLSICIHVHNAFHSGTLISRVMWKMTQVDPKRGLLRMVMLMDEPA